MNTSGGGDHAAWSARVESLPPAKRALLDELRRRQALAAGKAEFADVAWLRRDGQDQRDPVVLAHPIGGGLFCYRELVLALPGAFPVVGVGAGRALAVPAEVTIEDLARHDAVRVAEDHVRRPAVIAGWSFGGLLAYELARHWHRSSGLRPPVVLIDSVVAPPGEAAPDDGATTRMFAEYLLGLAGLTSAAAFDQETWQLPVEEALAATASQLRGHGLDLGMTAEELRRRYWMFANAARAMSRYQPAGYPGRVVLIRTEEAAQTAGPWPAAGNITTIQVSGDHYGVLRPPVVAQVADLIASNTAS